MPELKKNQKKSSKMTNERPPCNQCEAKYMDPSIGWMCKVDPQQHASEKELSAAPANQHPTLYDQYIKMLEDERT
jgi:hypothetical protein